MVFLIISNDRKSRQVPGKTRKSLNKESSALVSGVTRFPHPAVLIQGSVMSH